MRRWGDEVRRGGEGRGRGRGETEEGRGLKGEARGEMEMERGERGERGREGRGERREERGEVVCILMSVAAMYACVMRDACVCMHVHENDLDVCCAMQ